MILGDDWLMGHCLFTAGLAAIEKGDEACREILSYCNDSLAEGLKANCGDDPKAMIKELIRLTAGV